MKTFRKTTSEERTKVTLFREIKREFAAYTQPLAKRVCASMAKYPKRYFFTMIGCIAISILLAFSLFRVKEPKTITIPKTGAGVSTGVAQIFNSGAAFREVLDLQNQINLVLRKDSLSGADSLFIKRALKRLETINRELNPQNK